MATMAPQHASDIAVVSTVVHGIVRCPPIGMVQHVSMSILSLVIATIVLKVTVERAVFVRKRVQDGERVDG
jgi:hypothetical protein